MTKLKEGTGIELSDGKTYLCILSLEIDGHDYSILSPRGEEKYILGEVVEENGKRQFNIVEDEKIIQKVQDHYNGLPNLN